MLSVRKPFIINALCKSVAAAGVLPPAVRKAAQNLTAPFAPFIIDRCKGLRRKYLQVPVDRLPKPDRGLRRTARAIAGRVCFSTPSHCSVQ